MAGIIEDANCCLCGKKGTNENPITREHVPPKQFYPKSVRSQQNLNLWVVPTCRDCNESYKSDEEYFFHSLYPLVANTNRSMGETILQDLRRRAKQPQTPALIRSLLRTSRATTEAGIVLPSGMVSLSVDERRIQQVAIKIARCLFYRDHTCVMPYENCKDIRIYEREKDVPEFYMLSWEMSKAHVNDAQPMDPDGTVVVAEEHAGRAVAVCESVFSYRAAHLDDLYLITLFFWEAFVFCMTFSKPE